MNKSHLNKPLNKALENNKQADTGDNKDKKLSPEERKSHFKKLKTLQDKGKLDETIPDELDEFDHSKIKPDSFILVIGKRRYGKTTWAEWVLNNMWHFFPDGGYVFTLTKQNYCKRLFFLVCLASLSAIAMACLRFLTTGPRLLPLCNFLCLNSCMTRFTLRFALVDFGTDCIFSLVKTLS
jgi:hypothetical protein